MKNSKLILFIILQFHFVFSAYAGWMHVETREYNPKAREHLIAHEWGTKLNVQGFDGTVYDGLYFKKELAVPDFVYQFSDAPPLTSGQQGIIVKPILYFYADEPIEVRVEAICREGSWLEWYPMAIHEDLLLPNQRNKYKENRKKTVPADKAISRHISLGHKPAFARKLSWWGEIIPPDHEEYKKFQAKLDQNIPEDGWYPITRETDSAIFRARFEYPWANQVEKFLFYRGKSDIAPDIKVKFKKASSSISITRNGAESDSQPLFYIDNTQGKNKILLLDQQTALINQDLDLDKQRTLTASEAQAELSRIGQEAGLYKKEADGMAEIWTKDYFERPGRRLLYRIGPNTLEREQELKISPEPKEFIRFQIGWLELPSKSKIAQIEALVGRLEDGESVLQDIKREGFIAHPFMWKLSNETENENLRELIHEYFVSDENGI